MEEKKEDSVGTGKLLLDSLFSQTWLYVLFMIAVLCSACVARYPVVTLHRYDSYKIIFWAGGIALSVLLFISSLAVKKMKYNRFGRLTFFTLISFAVPGMLLMSQILFDIDHFIKPPFRKPFLPIFFGLLMTSFFLSVIGLLWRRGKPDFLVSLAVFLLFSSQIFLPELWKRAFKIPPSSRVMCMVNMRQLNFCFHFYYEENKGWPDSKDWCDLLHQEWGVETERFQCLKDLFGPCSYAINENIQADANELPHDLVLLFECPPGWNQVGGADDVVIDRHKRPGANIAFADGHVEFVKPEDIPNLRWTVDEQKRGTAVTR